MMIWWFEYQGSGNGLSDVADLQDILSSAFLEHPYFAQAVTHPSSSKPSNERLEFLGDAVLQLVISEWIYVQFPDKDEGELSRIRTHLVRRETQAELARHYQLENWLTLGWGEVKDGGAMRQSNLANALEAIIGALYLVEGLGAVQALIEHMYVDKIKNLPDVETLKDPKSRLQEYMQSISGKLPIYRVIGEATVGKEKHFKIECSLPGLNIKAVKQATSKHLAEQAAATLVLEMLSESGD